jgi:hypothetical protein
VSNRAGVLGTLKERALAFHTNARGWRTKRRLIVFESDDWGAIRMPGPQAYSSLLAAGIPVDKSAYDRLDCLENRTDFEGLMETLGRHRDSSGRPAVFTLNTVMGNPDFGAIRDDRFETFHHEHLFDSYRRVHGEDLESLWHEGISCGLIRPQFHAREHLNVPLWMRDLKTGRKDVRVAFEHAYCGLTTRTSATGQSNYLAAFWADSPADLAVMCENLVDGLEIFNATFGFRSLTFVPCNYVLADDLESVAHERGVRLIQGQRGQLAPDPRGRKSKTRRTFTGQRSSRGPLYSVRNVRFEPFENDHADWVARAMREIGSAFALHKPAVVCTHRVNYTSGMSVAHRDRSLRMLEELLKAIPARWPDAEFITSDELLHLMESD